MADVNDVWAHLIQQGGKTLVHFHISVPVARSRHVDDVQRHPRISWVWFLHQGVFGQKGIFLPREDMRFMTFGQGAAQPLRVHLGTSVVAHGIAVNNLQHSQARPRAIFRRQRVVTGHAL